MDRKIVYESFLCGDIVHTWAMGIWYRYGVKSRMMKINVLQMNGTVLKVEDAQYCPGNYHGYDPHH